MLKIKKLFDKVIFKLKSILDDNGIFSLSRSLILIFVLSIWTLIFQIIAQSFNVLQLYGPILLLNIIPIFLLMCLLYFTIGKISISYVIVNSLLSLLLTINHFKVKFRDEPLKITDFLLAKETKNIIQNYDISVDAVIFIMILFCLVSFWFVLKKVKNKRPNMIISVVGTIVTIALVVTANFTIYSDARIYDSLLSSLGIYQESKVVSSKGLVYSLINDSNVTKYQVPEGYSKDKVAEILNQYEKPAPYENTPNVIAVMCEAFADIQNWENLKFKDENPYAYYNYLKTKGCYGDLFVPCFAGGTATTEFEFLTGNNTFAISSAMPVAYKTLINKNSYSIARIFKDLGYEAVSMHPGYPWFYNRQNVYLRLGFDSFTSKDDLDGEVPNINTYALDTVASDMIINDYNRHLEESPDTGYFNFLVTIQNHGPYNGDRLRYEKEYISKDDYNLTDEEYYIINNYLGGIKSANDFIKTIYEYINTLEQPTVFIFFGDHLPYLDSEEQIFNKLGLDMVSDTYEAYENRYTTNYFIIGNNAYLKNNRPSIKGKQDIISSNYLSVKLLQYMNMELTPFHSFLYDMMQYAPIISKQHSGTSADSEEELNPEFDEMLKNYKILQYYNIKDYQVQKGENQ